jgi:hypothetical protein
MSTIDLEMPKTKTPLYVYITLFVLSILLGWLMYFVFDTFGYIFFENKGWGVWGIIFSFAVIGMNTKAFTMEVKGYDALIILDYLTGKQRTLFQKKNFTLPWENVTGTVNLKAEPHDVSKDETYSTKNGQMKIKFIYIIRPDASGDDAGKKIVRYGSFELDTIKMKGRAAASQTLSDWYGQHNNEELLDKANTEEEALRKKGSKGREKIAIFERDYGATIEVTLEDSDRDKAAQEAQDTIARSQAFRLAVEEMMKKPAAGGSKMNRKNAEKRVAQMSKLGVQEFIIGLDAKGLEKLEHLSAIIGGLGGKVEKK